MGRVRLDHFDFKELSGHGPGFGLSDFNHVWVLGRVRLGSGQFDYQKHQVRLGQILPPLGLNFIKLYSAFRMFKKKGGKSYEGKEHKKELRFTFFHVSL